MSWKFNIFTGNFDYYEAGGSVVVEGALNYKTNTPAIGAINGTNTAFTTPDDYIAGTLQVYYRGQRLTEGADNDFEETGANSFSLNFIPTDDLLVDYQYIV